MRNIMRLGAGVLIVGLAVGGCAAPSAPVGTGGTDGAEVSSAVLGMSAPTIQITSPSPNANLTFQAPAIDVEVSFVATDAAAIEKVFYLNGAEVGRDTAEVPFTFTPIYPGRHHLAVEIEDGGETVARAGIYIRVIDDCDSLADCADGNSCTTSACAGGTCSFGGLAGCCDSDAACPLGSDCVANVCVECQSDVECDDGNDCTDDSCSPEGICINAGQPDCCAIDGDCDDGDVCTEDSCNQVTQTCLYVEDADPLCCNTNSDCTPDDDPCLGFVCYHIPSKEIHTCRYGPRSAGCCVNEGQCNDGNPCTIDDCDRAVGEDSGVCTHVPSPPSSGCCVSKFDCNDNNPETLDICNDNVCEHADNPNFCALPDADAPVIITEVMMAPSPVADATGEWFEIYNTSDNDIDLEGWTIQASAGIAHEITLVGSTGSSGSLILQPREYFVFGNNANSLVNGGYFPQYVYGADLSLEDPYEDGGFTNAFVGILDGNGALVHSIGWTSTWPLVEGRSIELKHPNRENNFTVEHWAAAGTHANPVKNVTFGTDGQYGSPAAENLSSLVLMEVAECLPTVDVGPCDVGLCSPTNECSVGVIDGCCTEDAHCTDYDICTTNTCFVADNTCQDPETNPTCCADNADCDDQNPCNVDRCIGERCRHSRNTVEGCCTTDADCDDGDSCTVDNCDTVGKTCDPATPVDPGGGLTCCNDNDDCDDTNPSTIDRCDFVTDTCVSEVDPEYCTFDETCDDGDPCTEDSCNVGLTTCVHELLDGCCKVNSDCADDGDVCTLHVCNTANGLCETAPKPNCCNEDSECDDGDICTEDICGGNHLCHTNNVANCCESDAECDDSNPCSADTCVDDQCVFTADDTCCEGNWTQAQLVNGCGEDPDAGQACFVWSCANVDAGIGTCTLLQASECCDVHADCDDDSSCTFDVCQSNGTCKHLSAPPPEGNPDNCCFADDQCEFGAFCAPTRQCENELDDGSVCSGDNQCASGWCHQTVCTFPLAQGGECDGSQGCQSGLCVDGHCCDSVCDDPCQACDLAGTEGACTDLPPPDTNSDGEPDACDIDDDGDALADPFDNCPTVFNGDQSDIDGDNIGDVCDDDRDGDGAPDTTDNCRDEPNPEQEDTDNDNVGDACDTTPADIVISELYYDGPSFDSDDAFTELAGPAGLPLDGYELQGINGSNGALYRLIELDGMALGDDGLLVLATASAAGEILEARDEIADVDWQNGADAVRLIFPSGVTADAVQYGNAGVHNAGEGSPAADAGSGTSLSRAANLGDTDDNSTDFAVNPRPNPGVLGVAGDDDDDLVYVPDDNCPAIANADQTDTDGDGVGDACDDDDDDDGEPDATDNCPGVANDGADFDGDGIGNACDIVIQEVVYDGEGADSDNAFTEIVGLPGTNLQGWSLVGIDGETGFDYHVFTFGDVEIPGDAVLVVAGPAVVGDLATARDVVGDVDWQNGPDSVQLRDPSGAVIDALEYGDAGGNGAGEGTHREEPPVGLSLSRAFDGADTNDNAADFVSSGPTPGLIPPNPDTDSDGIVDTDDNCPEIANSSQADFDADELGDPCDPDLDGDGIEADADGSGTAGDNPCADGETLLCDDNCPLDPNTDQADEDGDGVGDICTNASVVALVIHEVYYDGPGSDADDAFTELTGPPGQSLTGYTMIGFNGSNGTVYRTVVLDGAVIPPDGLLVIATASAGPAASAAADFTANVDWQNGADGVLLVDSDGATIDALQYGNANANNVGEGAFSPDVSSGSSLTRDLHSTDTDDNATDFSPATPSPGVR